MEFPRDKNLWSNKPTNQRCEEFVQIRYVSYTIVLNMESKAPLEIL